jgi:hypothetical protein
MNQRSQPTSPSSHFQFLFYVKEIYDTGFWGLSRSQRGQGGCFFVYIQYMFPAQDCKQVIISKFIKVSIKRRE